MGLLNRMVRLAPRECQIAHRAAMGWVPKVIADELGISTRCVNNRLAGICHKVEVRGREELMVWILQHTKSLHREPCVPGLHPPGCHCEEPYCVAMLYRATRHPSGCRCRSNICKTLLLAA